MPHRQEVGPLAGGKAVASCKVAGKKTPRRKALVQKARGSALVVPTEPTAQDVAEREAVARAFFNPAAAAARAAFAARQHPEPAHAP